jgi:hypothetical protein
MQEILVYICLSVYIKGYYTANNIYNYLYKLNLLMYIFFSGNISFYDFCKPICFVKGFRAYLYFLVFVLSFRDSSVLCFWSPHLFFRFLSVFFLFKLSWRSSIWFLLLLNFLLPIATFLLPIATFLLPIATHLTLNFYRVFLYSFKGTL